MNKYKVLLSRILCFALAAAAVFFLFKYVFPCALPLILAFLTASLIEPAVRALERKFRIKRIFASGLCALTVLVILCAAAVFAVGRASYETAELLRDLPQLLDWLPRLLSSIKEKTDNLIGAAPPEISEYLHSALENLSLKVTELPSSLTGKLLSFVSSVISAAPKLLLYTVTFVIGVFFMSGSYNELKAFIVRQIPPRCRGSARNIKQELTSALIKWAKAQIMLICMTFLVLTASFLILGIKYAAFLALFTALIDALPVFGAGFILLPWAAFCMLSGSGGRAAALIIIYAAVTIIRNALEPRLVGSMLGIHQLAMLIAIYAGFCIAGIGGMLLFPILLVCAKKLSDSGYVKLWK